MDPDSNQPQLTGGEEVKPLDISRMLPRHPTKKYGHRALSDIELVVVHTTNWDTTPNRLAMYNITPYYVVNGKKIFNHISKTGCPAITYHEIIMNDGMLYKTLSWQEESWHVGIHNKKALGIALMYKSQNSDKEDVFAPSSNMLKSLQTRCGDICLELGLTPDKVVGHRELKTTGWVFFKGSRILRKTCPGMLLDLNKLRWNVAAYMQIKLKVKGLYSGKIDGIFYGKSQKALREWNA